MKKSSHTYSPPKITIEKPHAKPRIRIKIHAIIIIIIKKTEITQFKNKDDHMHIYMTKTKILIHANK